MAKTRKPRRAAPRPRRAASRKARGESARLPRVSKSEAPFVFRGTVLHRGVATFADVPVNKDTVVVRVDRLIKHPIYRKYVRKRKKFMAHDEMGAKIGDKVRIVETRPTSARKRWRVVEIIHKAEL